jgi:hypothetical protein
VPETCCFSLSRENESDALCIRRTSLSIQSDAAHGWREYKNRTQTTVLTQSFMLIHPLLNRTELVAIYPSTKDAYSLRSNGLVARVIIYDQQPTTQNNSE